MNPQEPKEYPDLHLYSPHAWHDDAFVIGTRAGLARLRDALNLALINDVPGEVTTDGVFCADGEGYVVRIILTTEEGMRGYLLPYTDEIARDRAASSALWPKKLGRGPHA